MSKPRASCRAPLKLDFPRFLLACLAGSLCLFPYASQAQEAESPPPASPEPKPESIIPPEGEPDRYGFGEQLETDDGTAGEDTPSNSEDAGPGTVEVVRARLATEPGHRWVRGLRRLRRDIGRVEWARQGEWIAFDRVSDTGFRGLYLGRADDSLERCLSCDHWDLRKSHVLSPTWHPSGKLIVAMVQGPAKKLGLDTSQLATPSRGLHTELWAFTIDGREAWGLTKVVAQGDAVFDPVFSFEGDRLAWTERQDTTRGGRWGDWVVRVAEFRIRRGLPRLGKITTYPGPPWPGFVTVDAFTQDDRGLLLSHSPEPGGPRRGWALGRLDLDGAANADAYTAVDSPGQSDQSMSEVPRGERRVFVSDRDVDAPDLLPQRNDLWLMSASGRRQERLTYFNDSQSPDYLGEAWIADTSWSPDGRHLLLQVLSAGPSGILEDLYALDLSPEMAQ